MSSYTPGLHSGALLGGHHSSISAHATMTPRSIAHSRHASTSTAASSHQLLTSTSMSTAAVAGQPPPSPSQQQQLQPNGSPSSSGSAAAATPSAAPSSALVSELVRKVQSFRRGLVRERKERALLELSLEEASAQQAQLTSLMREQDVQLLAALETSAQLEYELHLTGVSPLQSRDLQMDALESIFAKPDKAQREAELKGLFEGLSTIQQFYHVLEKRALSDRVAAEASNLALTRTLKAESDGHEMTSREARKYKLKCQELMDELREEREEAEKRREEASTNEASLKASLDTALTDLSLATARIAELEQERDEVARANTSLVERATHLGGKLDAIELTLRHFTCTRVRAHAPSVTCEISVKRVASTGELLLCVRDHRSTPAGSQLQSPTSPPLSSSSAGSTAGNSRSTSSSSAVAASRTNSTSQAVTGRLDPPAVTPPPPGEFEHEYTQDVSTVRCCAVDDEDANGVDGDQASSSSVEKDGLLPSATHLSPSSAVLGFRPRFLLCFVADQHRCLVFETSSREFRRNICETLQQFVRMVKDKHVDELGGFFGDGQDVTAEQ